MRVPTEFTKCLVEYLVEEILDPNGPRNGAACGQLAEQFARQWYGLVEGESEWAWPEGRELSAWAARLGKVLGEFLLNPKEV